MCNWSNFGGHLYGLAERNGKFTKTAPFPPVFGDLFRKNKKTRELEILRLNG